MPACSTHNRLLPRRAETHICDFTDLVAIAIANVQARTDLTASRARIVAATDQARHRVERDLHDGTQTGSSRSPWISVPPSTTSPTTPPSSRVQLSRIVTGLTAALNDLAEIVHGIHPAILTQGGLGPSIGGLARRSAVPVKLDVRIEARLPESVEITAYYIVAEALANAAKYAQASGIHVEVNVRDGRLHLSVRETASATRIPTRAAASPGSSTGSRHCTDPSRSRVPTGQGTLLRVELPITSG